MRASERRSEVRVNLRAPLQFRAVGDSLVDQREAESLNISQRGLCFSTTFPPKLGAKVEVYMKIPQELAGSLPTEVHCIARVVRIHDGRRGSPASVGLRVEQYEPVLAKERWAS